MLSTLSLQKVTKLCTKHFFLVINQNSLYIIYIRPARCGMMVKLIYRLAYEKWRILLIYAVEITVQMKKKTISVTSPFLFHFAHRI